MSDKQTVLDNLKEISDYENILQDLVTEIVNKGQTAHLELLLITSCNRTINLIRGYVLIANNGNWQVANHLIRLILDTLMRTYAIDLHGVNRQFVFQMIQGYKISHLVDVYNELMTDAYLSQMCAKKFHYSYDKLYNELSGHIHLSSDHIGEVLGKIDKENQESEIFIGSSHESTPIEDQVKSMTYVKQICSDIVILIKELK
jgi:hypothetical protein